MRLFAFFSLLSACYTPPSFDGPDGLAAAEPGALDLAPDVVAFVNDWQVSTLDELDHGCGLRSDSARAIHARRAGPNGLPGDGDDHRFTNTHELDELDMVGEATLQLLEECAQDWGFWSSFMA